MYANIASAKDRLTAFYFNFLFFVALVFLLSKLFLFSGEQLWGKISYSSAIFGAIFVILFLNTLIVVKTHNDFGKWILGLKIKNLHGEKSLSLYQLLVRSLISYVSCLILGLGSFAMIFNSERLTLQDLCANTLVVEDPNFKRDNFLIRAFYFISLLTGSLMSLVVATVLVCAPVPLLSNYLYEMNLSGYDFSAFYKPRSELEAEFNKEEARIPMSNGQIYALLSFKNGAEYVDFKVDTRSKKNYINQATLTKLRVPQTQIARYFQAGDKVWNFAVLPYINIEKLSIKDIESQEIDIQNQIFHIYNGENRLGAAFLGLFEYGVDKESAQLILKPHPYDVLISQEKLKPKSKMILSQIYRKLESDWKVKLRSSSHKFKDSAQRLKYDLVFDSNSGQITEITLQEPTVDQSLVAFTENFLKEYVILTKLNNELKRIPQVRLSLELRI